MIIIKTHSIIDLITNSSSELFVCNTSKTIDSLKEIVVTLLEANDKIEGTDYAQKAFTYVFGEPTLAEYTFNWYAYPREVVDAFMDTHPYAGDKANSHNIKSVHAEKVSATAALCFANDKKLGLTTELYKTNKEEYARVCEISRAFNREQHKKLEMVAMQAHAEMYKCFLKENNFSKKEIDYVDEIVKEQKKIKHQYACLQYPLVYEDEKDWQKDVKHPMEKVLDFFCTFCGSYRLTEVAKGSILLPSTSDNTVPYALFDALCSYLSATRIHQG